MNIQGLEQCLNMGVAGGIISRADAEELQGALEGKAKTTTDLLNRKQAAELIGKNIFTLDRYARKGTITKIQTAFGPRFRRSEILSKLKIKADLTALK
jgi:hypothetical protein